MTRLPVGLLAVRVNAIGMRRQVAQVELATGQPFFGTYGEAPSCKARPQGKDCVQKGNPANAPHNVLLIV